MRLGQQTLKRKLKLRMFVCGYIICRANARKAAEYAGSRGTPASLRVTGCRLQRLARAEGLFERILAGEDIFADIREQELR